MNFNVEKFRAIFFGHQFFSNHRKSNELRFSLIRIFKQWNNLFQSGSVVKDLKFIPYSNKIIRFSKNVEMFDF